VVGVSAREEQKEKKWAIGKICAVSLEKGK